MAEFISLNQIVETDENNVVTVVKPLKVDKTAVASIELHNSASYDDLPCSTIRVAGAAPYPVRETASAIVALLS